MDNLLHPSVASVQSFGACGVFQSDIPSLPQPRREFAAAMLGEDLVLCGGYQLFSTQKVSWKLLEFCLKYSHNSKYQLGRKFN